MPGRVTPDEHHSDPHGDVYRVVRSGNLAELKRYIDEGGDVNKHGGRFQGTPLMEACRFHKPKLASVLLDAGARVDATGGGSWTALHYACDGKDDPDLVVTLVEHGAPVNAADYKCSAGKKLLVCLQQFAQYLLGGSGRTWTRQASGPRRIPTHGVFRPYSTQAEDRCRLPVPSNLSSPRTPLHIACSRGFFDVAVLLLEAGSEPDFPDLDRRTPLHYAATHGSRESAALLVSFGADVSALDREKETPLHKAARGRHATTADLLRKAGSDPDAVNCWGELAGTLALEYKLNPATPVPEAEMEACHSCSAKKGRHYYFCKPEYLQELPDEMILGVDGRSIAQAVDPQYYSSSNASTVEMSK